MCNSELLEKIFRVSFISFSLTNELIIIAKAQYNGNFCGDKVGMFYRQSDSIGQLAMT
jgi:hypothetical protein